LCVEAGGVMAEAKGEMEHPGETAAIA
jgi:hypothetical protein